MQPHDYFQSERVLLRELLDSDLPLFHEWWNDPEVAHYQVGEMVRLNQEQTNTEMFRNWFKPEGANIGFTIVERASSEPIGVVNMWGASVKNRSATLAILVAKSHWNQGLGTEALQLVLNYAFNELNLHRVELTVFGFNTRAIRAYEKVGFRQVGRQREAIFRGGQWHDVVLMDILQREFREKAGG